MDVGQSERRIRGIGNLETSFDPFTKLNQRRRDKERQNKFYRTDLTDKLESMKKLRSESKGNASHIEGIRKIVTKLQNSNISSFSRKVESNKKSYSKERSRLKKFKEQVQENTISCEKEIRLEGMGENETLVQKALNRDWTKFLMQDTHDKEKPGKDNSRQASGFLHFQKQVLPLVENKNKKIKSKRTSINKMIQEKQKAPVRPIQDKPCEVVDIYQHNSKHKDKTEYSRKKYVSIEKSKQKFQDKLENIEIQFGVHLGSDGKNSYVDWKPAKQLRLEELFKEDIGTEQYQSLNYSVDPKKVWIKKPDSQRKRVHATNRNNKTQKDKAYGKRNKSSAIVSKARLKKMNTLPKKKLNSDMVFSLRENKQKKKKRVIKNYFQKLSKMIQNKEQKTKKKSVQIKKPKKYYKKESTLQNRKKGRIHVNGLNIKSMDMGLSSKMTNSSGIQMGREQSKEENYMGCFSSINNMNEEELKADFNLSGRKCGNVGMKVESISNMGKLYNTKKKRKEKSEPKIYMKKTTKRKKKEKNKKSALSYITKKHLLTKKKHSKFCFKKYFNGIFAESLRTNIKINIKNNDRKQKVDTKIALKNKLFGKGLLEDSQIKTSRRIREKKCGSNRTKMKKTPIIDIDLINAKPSKKSRKYVVNDILEKKGILINQFNGKFKPKNISPDQFKKNRNSEIRSHSKKKPLSIIKSSIVNSKRLSSQGKVTTKVVNPFEPKLKKMVLKKERNKGKKLKLVHQSGIDYKQLISPKIKQILKFRRKDENLKNKKNIAQKQKNRTTVTTKNLVNRLNKFSYFQFKKTKEKEEEIKANLQKKDEEESESNQDKILRNFSVKKKSKRKEVNHSIEKLKNISRPKYRNLVFIEEDLNYSKSKVYTSVKN